YALFSQHLPWEFVMTLRHQGVPVAANVEKEYKPDHGHDEAVTSVGIDRLGDLQSDKLNAWLSNLLQTKGQDIFRMKGVLSIKEDNRRYVFQGVHMLLDAKPDRPWGDDERRNRLIFIGRNLDRKAITSSFEACLA
ncbi:MAG: GTP-binding protein, partial [Fibrobacterota bacterium]|nr:GTP-binding protein [Fibrobacterota bacterium]